MASLYPSLTQFSYNTYVFLSNMFFSTQKRTLFLSNTGFYIKTPEFSKKKNHQNKIESNKCDGKSMIISNLPLIFQNAAPLIINVSCKNLEEKDGQTRVRRSVSAQVVACLAVITLIKGCYKILKSNGKQKIFSHYRDLLVH